MLTSLKRVLGVAVTTALMFASFVAGECDISIGGEIASSLSRPYYRPCPCEWGVIGFSLRYPPSTVCEATDLVVTLDFEEAVVVGGLMNAAESGGEPGWRDGEVGAYNKSITLTGDEFYYDSSNSENVVWIYVHFDLCNSSSLVWNDIFGKISYVDLQGNSIDSFRIDHNVYEHGLNDDGECGTTTPVTPPPATPPPTPAPTMRGAYCQGDPHCRTFDGLPYDCHGNGDFVLLDSADTGALVHARFEPEPLISDEVSFTTGIAAKEGVSPVIEVTVTDGQRTILIDGASYDGTGSPTLTGVDLDITDQDVRMVFPSGLKVDVLRWYTSPDYVGGVYVYAPVDMATVGILGTNNGNRANDWTDSTTGETIELGSTRPSVTEGTNYCTTNWQTEDSLFTSTFDLRRSRRLQGGTYNEPELPDVLPADIVELCGANAECSFDAYVAGLTVGAATLAAGDEFEAEVEAVGGELCEENTFSSDGLPPCTDCIEGETSGRGAVVCEGAPPAPTPSPVDETPDSTPVFLGCYKDVAADRIMDDLALTDYSMTTELCEVTCTGSAYFGIQYGRECWCGSSGAHYAKHGESTACTYKCPGNSDETCGGGWAISVYAYEGNNTPPPTTSPVTPAPTTPSPPTPTTSTYLGCFKDSPGDRLMELALTDGSSMTHEMCEAECTGSAYFGLQYGRECWCGGEDTEVTKHGESTACSYECPGDPDQTCGGGWAISVFETFAES